MCNKSLPLVLSSAWWPCSACISKIYHLLYDTCHRGQPPAPHASLQAERDIYIYLVLLFCCGPVVLRNSINAYTFFACLFLYTLVKVNYRCPGLQYTIIFCQRGTGLRGKLSSSTELRGHPVCVVQDYANIYFLQINFVKSKPF